MADLLLVALNGVVVALDRSTGAIRWENGLEGGGFGTVALAAVDERVYASAESSQVYCLRYDTGETLWQSSAGTSGRATIVVQNERVYVAKGGEVTAFSTHGTHLWTQKLPGKGGGSIALGFPGNLVQSDDVGRD